MGATGGGTPPLWVAIHSCRLGQPAQTLHMVLVYQGDIDGHVDAHRHVSSILLAIGKAHLVVGRQVYGQRTSIVLHGGQHMRRTNLDGRSMQKIQQCGCRRRRRERTSDFRRQGPATRQDKALFSLYGDQTPLFGSNTHGNVHGGQSWVNDNHGFGVDGCGGSGL